MSQKFSINKENLIKVAKFLALSIVGVLLTGLEQFLLSADFGQYGTIIALLVNSGLLKLGHEWISDEQGKIEIMGVKI